MHPLPSGMGLTLRDTRTSVLKCSLRDESRVLLSLDGIRSREAAEQFAGSVLSATTEDVRPLLDRMVPLDMFGSLTLTDSRLGVLKVTEVQVNRTNPQLVVEPEGGESFLVPLLLVLAQGKLDWDSNEAEVELPEGIESVNTPGTGASGA